MPGVPSGRGCEACRKQKKKCDQAKPSCGRCARLRIECVGAGVQRFQFKEHRVTARQAASHAGASSSAVLVREPSSPPIMRVSYEFMQAFRGEDLRYDLNVYGFFLQGIPRRLGKSKALDASASAVVRCLSAYQRKQPTCPVALASYVEALGALRTSLIDPATAGSPDTLCSIYLVLMCQGWIGTGDIYALKHGEAIAFILKRASTQTFDGEFENWLVLTLIVPVIMEAVMNPNITLGPWLYELLDKYMNSVYSSQIQGSFESCSLRNIVRLPAIMKDPLRHMPYVGFAYEAVREDVARMRQMYERVQQMYEAGAESGRAAQHNLRMYGSVQSIVGIILTVANLFAGLLAADDPSNTEVVEEAASYRRDALVLTKTASIHRPIGTSYMTLLLVTAWAASDDPEEMAELWAEMEDYASDFPPDPWQGRPLWLRSVFDTVRLNSFKKASGATILPGTEVAVHTEYCVVM